MAARRVHLCLDPCPVRVPGCSRVPLLPAGRGAPGAGAAAAHQPQDSWAPGFLGRGHCRRGCGCLGRVSVVVDSVGHVCFSCSGAAQTQQGRAGPTPGTQGRVWMDTPVGRSRRGGTFQLPQPLSLPSVGRSQPQPRRLLGNCHLSPHQPGCSSSEGLSSAGQRKRLLTPGLAKKFLPEQEPALAG